ncbi:MAG: hypothetical protein JRN06_04825 [Nitrososphaerota archaeon]|nr:hypothetical protein [Nitrososphaerota archaeon]MDG7023942.1 hypothetical protein [Nitrososphaerota archaeon]
MSGAKGEGDGGPSTASEVGHSPASQVQPLQRPERRLTILFLATAVILGFAGTTLGALMLAYLSGVPSNAGLSLFPSHPFIQIFGFVSEFVMGVGYSLLPRFKVGHIPKVPLAYAVYGAMTSANVAFIASQFTGVPLVLPLAALLTVGGSLIFTYHVISIVRRPAGGFPEVTPLLILSPASLVLATVLLFLELERVVSIGGGVFSPQLVFLALVGFAGSEIYAVQIRSVSLRQCDYRKRAATSASILQGAAVATAFADSLVSTPVLSVLTGVLFLAAASSVLLSIKVLELAHPLMLRPAMTKMHYTIMRYNEVCILSAAAWLLVGCALGIAWFGFGIGTFLVRDSFIHSIAIGFIGADITCFAPMLLPGLLGRKGPVTGLSYWPIALLDLGVAIRIAGNLQTFAGSGLPIWEAVSGPVILAAMVWFLLMLKNVGVKRPEAPKQPGAGTTEMSLKGDLEGLIDVGLSVGGLPSAKPVPVWFVERKGVLYSLPLQGTKTLWYMDVVRDPKVTVTFRSQTFHGTALPVTDAKEVRRIVRWFKDRYGLRNYENYIGARADVGVKIEIELA